LTFLYGAKCWPIKKHEVLMMRVAQMRMLRWMCGHTRLDEIKNEVIRDKVGVASIEDKMREAALRFFGYISRRSTDAPTRTCERVILPKGTRG